MQYAIISDVHGNLPALNAVLENDQEFGVVLDDLLDGIYIIGNTQQRLEIKKDRILFPHGKSV